MPPVATATKSTTTVTLPRGQTRAAFEPGTVDVEKRSAELVWTTGARVLRHGLYGGPWFEELSLEDQAVDLARLNGGAPLLAAHRSAELDQVLGIVERAWLVRTNGTREGRARVRFSKRPEVDGVLIDVKDGILRAVSVGYITHQLEEVDPGDAKRGEPPVYRATRWEPVELSLVPVPADPGAGVRTGPGHECHVTPRAPRPRPEEKPMSIAFATPARPRRVSPDDVPLPMPSRTTTVPDPLEAAIAARSTAAVNAALTALEDRPPEQCDRCGMRQALLPPGRPLFRRDSSSGWWRCQSCWGGTFRALPSPAEAAEATRTARVQARAAVLAEAEARVAEAVRTAPRPNRLTPALVRGMVEALLHRAVPTRYPATAASSAWRDHCPLVELCREYLETAGHPPIGRDRYTLSTAALRRTGAPGFVPITRAQGFVTTSDLPGLLDNVARTIFLDTFADTMRSFEAWTMPITVADFRSSVASVAEFPPLLELPEHAEYVAGNPFGPAVPVRLTCFGRIVDFTREALLRDDVAGFGQLQQALAVAAARSRTTSCTSCSAATRRCPMGSRSSAPRTRTSCPPPASTPRAWRQPPPPSRRTVNMAGRRSSWSAPPTARVAEVVPEKRSIGLPHLRACRGVSRHEA
jgi:hypothetical protein